ATPTFNALTLTNGLAVDSTLYSTGTASQSAGLVIGSGTTFPATSAGGLLCWTGTTNCAYVLAYLSGSQLVVTPSQTVSSGAYTLRYASVQSDAQSLSVGTLLQSNAGGVAIGSTS